jgi:hypothetical protein
MKPLTRKGREKRSTEAGEGWEALGYVEIRPGHYMAPEDLTPAQRRSYADGNRIYPHHRFGWTLIHRTGVRYTRAGYERAEG